MAQTLGIAEISWRGKDVPVEKGSKLKLGGIKNNSVINGQTVSRAQEYEASEVSVTTSLYKDQRFRSMWTAEEGELIVRCDTGQTYTFPDAFLTDLPTMSADGSGGKIELKWAAGNWTEVV